MESGNFKIFFSKYLIGFRWSAIKKIDNLQKQPCNIFVWQTDKIHVFIKEFNIFSNLTFVIQPYYSVLTKISFKWIDYSEKFAPFQQRKTCDL